MIGLIGAGINAIGGIAKLFGGARRTRRARKAIENYQRQTLGNAYNDVSVSTLGADLRREENARLAATSVDALRSGGIRGVVGGIGSVMSNTNRLNREVSVDLDRQRQQIEFAKAQDDTRIRQMQERREEQDLAGLGQSMNVGRQDAYSGLGDIGSTLMSFGGLMGSNNTGSRAPSYATPTLSPMGMNNMGSLNPIDRGLTNINSPLGF